MSRTTVTQALAHIGRLIPTRAYGSSSDLTGHPVWVLTGPGELPDAHGFRQGQTDRRAHYLRFGQRVPAGGHDRDRIAEQAPRYVVTSYGVPIAWVTLDGRTHYAHMTMMDAETGELSRPNGTSDLSASELRTMRRHRDAIRAAWPERFALDSMGDPIGPAPSGTLDGDAYAEQRPPELDAATPADV